jgi:hypothetical protein
MNQKCWRVEDVVVTSTSLNGVYETGTLTAFSTDKE